MQPYILWLIVAGFFLFLEIVTEGFLVFWFGVGAGCSTILSIFFPENYILQFVVFAVVSTILVLSTRKLSKKIMPKDVPSNVYSIIGKNAVVTVEIDNLNSKGQIRIDGDVWSARSETDEVIPIDSKVTILRIDGVKAVVKLNN